MQEAKHTTNISIPRLRSMVRTRELEGKVVIPQGGHRRNECWIRRSSLKRLIDYADTERQRYFSLDVAAQTLGLSLASVSELILCKFVSSIDGPDKHLPRGKYIDKSDIGRLRSLCLSFWGHELDVLGDGDLISLADARRSVVGGRGTLSRVFTALIEGSLSPLGHTSSASDVLFNDLVFRRSDLKKYAIPAKSRSLPTGFITHKEAACKLRTNREVIRNLVASQVLFSPPGRFNRFRIVSLKDVESFDKIYTDMRTIADRFKTSSDWVSRFLKNGEIEVLDIDLPGKGKKLFIKRCDIPGIAIPRARRAQHQPACASGSAKTIPASRPIR